MNVIFTFVFFTEGKLDESIDDEPESPSLLCSQAVLGDSTNYSVSINNEKSLNLGHSGKKSFICLF